MTEWIVRRWARYGHERLYAETPGGTALGYYDLKTGRYHSDDLSNLPLLEKAIADHLGPQPAPPSAASSVISSPPPPPVPRQPEWDDLSLVQPGAAARERALAEREAQGRFIHFLARAVGARTNERAWRLGADGEQAVAAQLWGLQPQWRILHAVRVGNRGSDIDHVAIGPGGVFTINAKHHPGARIWVGGDTFMVNGQRVPYIRNSRHEAHRASRLLTEAAGFPVSAIGVIAVVGARRGYTVKSQPKDGAVVVIQRRRISHLLKAQPARLSTRDADAIFEAARRSITWR